MKYLLVIDLDDGPYECREAMERRIRKSPLFGYACIYWGIHAQSGSEYVVGNLIVEVLSSRPTVCALAQVLFLDNLGWWDVVFDLKHVQSLGKATHEPTYPACVEINASPPNDCQDDTDHKEAAKEDPIAQFNRHETMKNSWKHANGTVSMHLIAHYNLTSLIGIEPSTANLILEDDQYDAADPRGQTPLSLAAERGHGAVVESLLSRNDVNVDSRDSDGLTPLPGQLYGAMRQ